MEATIELKHLHEHPLLAGDLPDGEEPISCSGCCEDILPGCPIFICIERQQQCKFVLHKSCGLLPKKITNFLHTRHPLTLYPKSPYVTGRPICNSCRKDVDEEFVYHCSVCEFDLDIRCARALLSDVQEQRDKKINWISRGRLETEESVLEMELRHAFHEHPLKLISQQPEEETRQNNKKCGGCLAPIFCSISSFYGCSSSNDGCEFFLHNSCAKMPLSITAHPSHTVHPLTLLEKHPCLVNYPNCDACGDPIKGFLYHCSVCGHNLDITCASAESRRFGQKGHNHRYIELWATPASFTCDICGVQSKGKSFLCTICQVRLHQSCASLPSIVKIGGHRHPLKLAFGSQREEPFEVVQRSCERCCRGVDTTYGFYYCKKCKYIADLECGTSELYRDPDFDANDLESNDEFEEDASDSDGELVIDDDDLTSLHWHGLILFEGEPEIPRKCKRCWSFISMAPYYGCTVNCGYFYHESCAELPVRIYHALDDHELIFEPGSGAFFACGACGIISNCSRYQCEECDLVLDVDCGLRSKSIKIDKAHEHPLRLIREPFNRKRICRGCRLDCDKTKYRCPEEECDYNVCFRCIGLPISLKHPWDEHPLELTYESVENEEEYYCDQCEEPRDPDHWFYHCAICERDVHRKCMNLHNLDLRETYNWNKKFHDPHHIFTLVGNPQVYATCGRCGSPCKDLYLHCLDCKYNLHFWDCDVIRPKENRS